MKSYWFTHLALSIVCFATGCSRQIDTQMPTPANHQPQIEVAFTQADQRPDQLLMKQFGQAKQSLDIAIYGLTANNIVESILDAHSRGVNVRMITDSEQLQDKDQKKQFRKFVGAGIPVKTNTHEGHMHLKISIIDGNIATTGSSNYRTKSSTVNDDLLVVLHDTITAKKFTEEFQRMWDDKENFIKLE